MQINAIGTPFKGSGMRESSRRSRIPDMRSIASVKPRPAVKPKTLAFRIEKLYGVPSPPFAKYVCELMTATPSTAQFVVISGR